MISLTFDVISWFLKLRSLIVYDLSSMKQTFRATNEDFTVHDFDEISNRSRQKKNLKKIYSEDITAQQECDEICISISHAQEMIR